MVLQSLHFIGFFWEFNEPYNLFSKTPGLWILVIELSQFRNYGHSHILCLPNVDSDHDKEWGRRSSVSSWGSAGGKESSLPFTKQCLHGVASINSPIYFLTVMWACVPAHHLHEGLWAWEMPQNAFSMKEGWWTLSFALNTCCKFIMVLIPRDRWLQVNYRERQCFPGTFQEKQPVASRMPEQQFQQVVTKSWQIFMKLSTHERQTALCKLFASFQVRQALTQTDKCWL